MSKQNSPISARRISASAKRQRNLANLARSIGPVLEKLEQRQLLSAAPAGTLDGTFNLTGKNVVDLGGNDIGSALALTASGDIVVGGSSNGNFAVTLLDPTGNVLSSITTQINGSSSAQINGIAIDSSGDIVVVGQVADSATREDIAVARYIISGHSLQLDSSFVGSGTSVDPGSVGYEVTDLNAALGSHAAPVNDAANAVAITPGGDIVVAGETGSGLSEHAFILAYTNASLVDTSMFGANHGIMVSTGSADFANAITVTSAGGVIAAGGQIASGNAELFNPNGAPFAETVTLGSGASINAITTYGISGNDYLVAGVANSGFVLAEVDATGALVSGFGTAGSGEIQTSFGSTSAAANALAVQSNGKIVVAGSEVDHATGNEFFALARYNANGTFDSSFGTGGTVTTDFSGGTAGNVAGGVAIQSDGQIVAAGLTGGGANPDNFAVARYIANNAPVAANATASLDDVDENANNPAGTTVAALASRFGLSDPDGDAVGLAITAADDAFGAWQYSTDAGSTWNPITGVSAGYALLLAPSSNNVVRFVPTTGDTGTSSLSVQAWDQTKGSDGSFANIPANAAANYNSFSDATLTANVLVSPVSPPTIVYVNDTFTGVNGSNVTDGFGQHILGVDAFSTIQAAVNAVETGGTVEVDAGTYAENVTVNKSIKLLGAQAGQDANTRSGPESIITSPGLDSGNASSDLINITASNVTVDGFLLNGVNSLIAGSGAHNGIATVDAGNDGQAVNNITIENNIVENVGHDGIAMINPISGAAVTSGDQITGNVLSSYGDYGVILAYNAYGDVTANTITMPDNATTGIWIYDFTQNGGTNATQTINVSQNNVTVSQDAFSGIWANLDSAPSATLNITNNTVNAGADVTGTDGLTFGIYLTSLESGFGADLSGNHVGVSGGQFAAGISLWNLPTTNTVTVSGGTIGDSLVGIQADNDDINFGRGSNTAVDISGVTISGATTGVLVSGDSTGGTIAASIAGNTSISGGQDGIDVTGPNAALSFTGASPASISTVSGQYIALTGGAEVNQTIDASQVSFDGNVGASLNPSSPTDLATFYAIENKITDAIDDATLGVVSLKSGDLFVAHASESPNAGAIQRAVNVANTGDNIYVQAGLFQENLSIDKSVALHGAYAGTSGVSASGVSPSRTVGNETEILTNGNQDAIIQVTAANVTIDGFYLEGNDPSVVGSTLASGVDSNALYGVLAGTGASSNPDAVSNLTVENDVVKDVFIGVRGDGVNTVTAVTGGLITDNWFDSIGNFDFGYAVSLRTSFYADVTNNLMTRVWTGIHLNDFHLSGGPAVWTISGNNIQSYAAGLLYWLQYGSATPLTFTDNQISAVAGDAVANNFGVIVTTVQGSDGINFTQNTITGTDYGIGLTNVSTSDVIMLDGTNSIAGTTIAGVYLTDNLNFDPVGTTVLTSNSYTGPSNAINVDIAGMPITAASGVGVEVQTSRGSNDVTATATINNDTSITTGGSGTGILVSGANATADITGNDASIFGNNIGIQVTGGSATISNNHIYDNTTGVDFTAGGSGSVSGNNFAGSTDNGTDLKIDSSAGAITIGDGNSFAAITNYIDNQSSQNFDLSGDLTTTFGGFNAAQTAVTPGNLATFYNIEDEIVDNLDNPLDGYVRIKTGYDFVTHKSETTTAGAVQRAVNDANTSDIVDITSGSFAGAVSVAKDLTLNGAGNGVGGTTIVAPAAIASQFIANSVNQFAVIYANANDVVIENLIVNGNSSGNPGYGDGFLGIGYFNAGGTVNQITIENVEDNPLDGVQSGVALYADNADGAARSLNVTNNTILNYQKNGMTLDGANLTLDVATNVVTGAGNTPLIAQNGIEIDDGAIGTISGNTVSGNEYSGASGGSNWFTDVQAIGILLTSGSSGLQVTGNIVDGNDIGIANNSNSATISGNQLGNTTANRYFGILLDQGSAALSTNSIKGGNVGVFAATSDHESDTTSGTLTGNTISGANIGIEAIKQSSGDTAVNILAQTNYISGNTNGVFISDGATATVSGNNFTGSPNGTDLVVDSTAGTVTVGDGNKFAGTTYIQDLSSQTIDLTVDPNTTFSGNQPTLLNPSSPTDLATLYGIEDRIVDNLDNPLDGYVRIKAGYDFVTQKSETTTAGAVQRAVNDANPNDIVDIAGGSFAGAVSVTQDLTLNGAGNGVGGTTIVAPAAITSQFATGSGDKFAVIYAGANDVVIENLIVNGNSSGNPSYGDGFQGIGYFNAGGTVNQVTIENVQDNPLDGIQSGVALYADNADSATRSLDVTDNIIQTYQKNGMALSGAGLTVDVDGNTVTGTGATPLIAQNGIQVGFGAGGIINNNTVSGDSYTGSQVTDAAGILLAGSGAGTSVTNNTISGSDVGVDADGTTGPVAITGNVITGSPGHGILISGSGDAFDIGLNTISGGVGDGGPANNTGDGIDLFGDVSGSTIHNNLISGNTGTGIYVDSSVVDSAGNLPVNDNSISGNVTTGLDNESPVTVDATSNWWNSANGPTAAGNSYNVGHQGDSITGPGTTLFTPWLDSGHNNAPPGPGFIPDANISFAPVSGATTGTEGATYTLSLGQSPDIASWSINWGDGTISHPDIQNVVGDPANVTHVFAEFGTYTISASATSNTAQPISSNSITVLVADAALNLTGGVTLSTTEGQAITNANIATLTDTAGTSSNPGDLSGTIDWGDHTTSAATLVENGNTGVYSVEGTHTYADYGSYTVSITINDVGGQSTSTTSSAAIADATLSAVGTPVSATEGQALTNVQVATLTDAAGTFSNPHDLSAVINWGDSSTSPATLVEVGNTGVYTVEGSHTYAEFGGYPIHVAYTDNDGNAGGSTTTSNSTATVADAALSLSLNPLSPVEGVPLNNIVVGTLTDGAGIDSNPSDLATTIHWGDGQTSPGTLVEIGNTGVYNVEGTHTYAHSYNGITFEVDVTDAGGQSASKQETINVAFNPPTVDLTGSATSTSVGSTYTLDINNVTDPGPNNILGYIIDWGDGTLTDAHAGGSPANQTFNHTFEIPNAVDNVTVSIIDSDGSHNAVLIANNTPLAGAFDVNVNDVPPTATPQNFLPVVTVGSAGLVGLSNPMSVSTYETGLGFTYSFDFNSGPTDNGVFQIQNSGTSTATVPAPFLASPGEKLVVMRIQDAFGDFTDYSTDILVNDVAPSINLGTPNPASATQNATFTRNASFTYPGNDAPYTALVDYNFGGVGDPGFSPLTLNPNNTFTLSNTYNTAGSYTIEVKVTDAFGTTGTATLPVNVTPSTFQVTSFNKTPSGFDVTFNRAANLNVLNLYSSGSGPYGAPDVTLVGQHGGQVEGSLIWDPSTNTAEFIKTAGVLAADTYTVTLVSGSSAWEDVNNNVLDGLDNNTFANYVTSFTISAPTDVVNLPDFARGPGQAVNTPYTGSTGLPISISDGAGVTDVDLVLNYNPADLSIGNVTLASGLPAGWSVNFSNNAVLGQLAISVFGLTSLSSGPQTLVNVASTVPLSATYGASAALNITSLRINEGAIAATAGAAVEKVALLGNASGSGMYDPFDAFLIDNVVVQQLASNPNAGFDAYPLTDPLIIGDATEDGTLSGQDASLVAQEAIGLSHVLPALAAGYTPSGSVPPGTDPNISIPTSVLANPGTTINLPVDIDNASQLASGLFTLGIDPTKLLLTNVTAGSVDPGFAVFFNPANDEFDFFSTSQPLISGSGSVANLQFTVLPSAASGTTPVTVTGDLNGGGLVTTFTNGSVNIETPSVANQYTFYNNSKFDGNNPAGNTSDYNAIATDKTALLPGNTATFANYTSYSKGLNGILVDFANLANPAALNESDFEFSVGNNNTPPTSSGPGSGWTTAPTPASFTTWTGPNGDTFADIIWADNSIQNQWLQVQVLANSDTRLSNADVFYFGNAIGSTGITPTSAQVTSADVTATQSAIGPALVGITNNYDFNRDGRVTAADKTIVQNAVAASSVLQLISVPANVILLSATPTEQVLSTSAIVPLTAGTNLSTGSSKNKTSTGKAGQSNKSGSSTAHTTAVAANNNVNSESLFSTKKLDASWVQNVLGH